MARPIKENTRKSVFGKKLESLISGEKKIRLCGFFDVGMTALSKYLNGDSTPSMGKLQEFLLNYAAANQRKMIDLNWLMDDHDRREGPVFVGEITVVPVSPVQRQVESLDRPPNSKAMIVPRTHIDNAEWWQDDQPQWVTRGAGAADNSFGQRVPDTDDLGETEQPPEGLTLVPVEGDSMEPVVLDHQYVMIDKYREGFEGGGGIIVAVVMNEYDDSFGTYIKRCFVDGKFYIFESEKEYPDLRFPIDSVRRIWPVIGTWFAGKGKSPKRKHRGSTI